MSNTYLTVEELAERIKYEPRYIREQLKDRVFFEGVHYVRPFGRKILFLWEAVEREMLGEATPVADAIPLSAGGVCRS
jgi:hypothetical protein